MGDEYICIVIKGLSHCKRTNQDYRIKITNQLNYHINADEDFKSRHKNGRKGAFKRNRSLPFSYLIISILKIGKNGLQLEMDAFLKETEDTAYNIRRVTKSVFNQSRKNLSAEAFLKLNDIIVKDFYKEVEFLGFKNRRLLAVDGGFLNLPNHPTIEEEFGIRKMGRGKIHNTQKSMCLLSLLYDPANYLTPDVRTVRSYEWQ